MAKKYEAIQELNKIKLAYLLNDIKLHPEAYPKYPQEWISWLDEEIKNKENLFDILPVEKRKENTI